MKYSAITLQVLAAKECGIIKNATQFWREFSKRETFEMIINSHLQMNSVIEKLSIEFDKNENDVGMVSVFDNEFPMQKFSIVNDAEKPYLLFYRGDISLLADYEKNVAVIGLVNPNNDIEKRERIFVKQLVNSGCRIISGLAKGCDTIAHEECIANGGKTIAILPTTLKRIYPAENKKLAENIVETGGLLITEYYMEPNGKFEAVKRFTDRDRLQAMFSNTIILTASYRQNEGDSGSRHAMKYAKAYSIMRYMLFDPQKDFNEPKFGLNYDFYKNEKNVKILTIDSIKTIIDIDKHEQWVSSYQPMLGDKLIFDLEGTLVFTDDLNTKCYNLALQKHKKEPIKGIKRITKNIVKQVMPQISEDDLMKICNEKQKLFLSKLGEIKPNSAILEIVKTEEKNNVIVLTRSDLEKAEHILEYFNLKGHILKIISKSSSAEATINIICEIFDCSREQLVFFDDDKEFVQILKQLNLRVYSKN